MSAWESTNSGYGIPGETVNGTDTLAVQRAVAAAAQRARSGGGATLIELEAYRWGGQTLKDPNRARTPEQLEATRQDCSIALLRSDMETRGLLKDSDFDRIVGQARRQILAAEDAARSYGPLPNAASTLDGLLNVYAS